MKNCTQDPAGMIAVQWTNTTGSSVAAGALVLIGTLVGIAAVTIANGATGAVHLAGRFTLAKANGVTLTAGQQVGWDSANSRVTADLSAGPIGNCPAGAASAALTCEINLNGIRPPPKIFNKKFTPTAGEATANVMDIPIGMTAANATIIVSLLNTSGVQRPATVTLAPGGVTTSIRVAETDIVATDQVHVLAIENTSA